MSKLILNSRLPRVSGLQLRPASPQDREFLYQVFCSTRPDVVHAPLPVQEIERLLQMQFWAQHTDYQSNYSNAQYSLVLFNGVKIGRIYIDRRINEIRILDIALLHDYRGQGLGSKLVSEIIEEARAAEKPVRIHVELGSREIKFYERLNFKTIGELPTHQLMECR